MGGSSVSGTLQRIMARFLLGALLLTGVRGQDPTVANGELTPPDLPFPPMPSAAVIGPTLPDSKNSWPPKRKPLKKDVPNIVTSTYISHR